MKKEREEMVRKKKHLHKFCIFQRRPVEKEKNIWFIMVIYMSVSVTIISGKESENRKSY